MLVVCAPTSPVSATVDGTLMASDTPGKDFACLFEQTYGGASSPVVFAAVVASYCASCLFGQTNGGGQSFCPRGQPPVF